MYNIFGVMIFLTIIYVIVYIVYGPIALYQPTTHKEYRRAGVLFLLSGIFGILGKAYRGTNNSLLLFLIFIAGIALLVIGFKKK